MNDPREIRRRLLRYFVPAVALSLACNVPKFFETEAAVVASNATADAGAWPYPGRRVELRVTDMRVDPWYSSFVNWSQVSSPINKQSKKRRGHIYLLTLNVVFTFFLV